MMDAGLVVLAAFVSPRNDRDDIRKIVGADNMVEIYINTSVKECDAEM